MRCLALLSTSLLVVLAAIAAGCEAPLPSTPRSAPVASPVPTLPPAVDVPPVVLREHRLPAGEFVATGVTVPDLDLGRFVIGRPASAEHREGTIVAVGGKGGTFTHLVEIDVASRQELGRIEAPNAGLVYREGDTLYAPLSGHQKVVLSSFDLPLALRGRVSFRTQLVDDKNGIFGFSVVDGHPIVIGEYLGVEVFDAAGKRLASHQCEGNVHEPGHVTPIVFGGRVFVVPDFFMQLSADDVFLPACVFDVYGRTPFKKVRLPYPSALVVRDGVLVATTGHELHVEEVHAVSANLDFSPQFTEAAIREPRACDGLPGAGRNPEQRVTFGNVDVVDLGSCCVAGGKPRIFVCDAGE